MLVNLYYVFTHTHANAPEYDRLQERYKLDNSTPEPATAVDRSAMWGSGSAEVSLPYFKMNVCITTGTTGSWNGETMER